MRRFGFALFLAGLMVIQAGAQDPAYVMRVLYPGAPSARMESFLANEFHAAVLRDLNIDFRMEYAPWSVYHEQIDLRMATNQAPDWFWGGTYETGLYMSRHQVRPLDDLLKSHGADILRVIPPAHFRPNTIAGKIYSSRRSVP